MLKSNTKNPDLHSLENVLDTPVMRQYQELKQKYPNEILLFRMGDFYELFLEDAKKAALILDLALTHRQKSIPMAGVPHHSIDNYLNRLLDAGYHVAIAEQEPDPRNPRLMQRRVRRILTPGTLIEERLLTSLAHNYLMSIVYHSAACGIAFADVSTGDFFAFEAAVNPPSKEALIQFFRDYYAKFSPREVLIPSELYNEFSKIPEAKAFVPLESWKASPTEGRRQIKTCFDQDIHGLGCPKGWSICLGAVSLILHYVQQNFPQEKLSLQAPVFRSLQDEFMQLDEQSIRNLDLVYNQREGSKNRTLYSVLDQCKTSVGKRFLRESILLPLLNHDELVERQDIVFYFVQNSGLRSQLQEKLKEVSDLERILTRLTTNRGIPRDFPAILSTIKTAAALVTLWKNDDIENTSTSVDSFISPPEELLTLSSRIAREVHPEPPAVLPGNTPFIQSGLDERLDKAREVTQKGSHWLSKFEKQEREQTGISNLRVKYNRVHGYFIEVSRARAKEMPANYYRKQTLASCERFSNKALSDLEISLREAEATIQTIEQERFKDLCQAVWDRSLSIKKLMEGFARIDFFLSLAAVADKKQWTKPEIISEARMEIEEAYHPIVEHYLPVGNQFTPNDFKMELGKANLAILTGPNMAGKSTYIRQAALIQILAQIGSFVPARKARLGIKDRIFTRIGAGDNLTRGESTFFVEMLETAHILNQATSRSLVIMDEVGRGTSTYDGVSLAWAIVEYLSDRSGPTPLTLFATHYYELTELEQIPGVFNLTMAVHENEGEVVFLHRVEGGSTSQSYGIHVARLAGIPKIVIERAQKKLDELQGHRSQKFHSSMKEKIILTSKPKNIQINKEQELLF